MISWNLLKIISEVAGLIVLGAFGGIYLLSNGLRLKRKDENDAEDRLNSLLQQTVESLEKKVTNLENARIESDKKIKALESENGVITKILQGRDSRSEDLYAMTKQNSDSIKAVYGLLEKHMAIVEKALNIKIE